MWQALFLSGEMRDSSRILQLAHSCDQVWTADGGLDRARQLGLKPSLHMGDNDSLSSAGLAYLQEQNIPQVKFPVKKDEPDSALALHHMLKQEYNWRRASRDELIYVPQGRQYDEQVAKPKAQRVTGVREAQDSRAGSGALASCLPGKSGIMFLAGLGARMDHVLANLDLASRFARPDLVFLLTDGLTDIWTLKGPCQLNFRLADQLQEDSYISLLAVSPEVSGVSLSPAMWPLENRKLFKGVNLGISNQVLQGEEFQLELGQGTLRLVVSRENKDQVKLEG